MLATFLAEVMSGHDNTQYRTGLYLFFCVKVDVAKACLYFWKEPNLTIALFYVASHKESLLLYLIGEKAQPAALKAMRVTRQKPQ